MFSVEKPERPGEVHLNHILFVEGTNESVDVTALGALFDNDLRIEALGPSYSIKSVAQALHSLHPLYYFLIDRDHYHLHEEFIQKCWADFPNPETHNLLIWKKKEFENYFLDPNYLSESQYCQVSKQKLEQKILQVSQKRLFIDAANYVVIEIREKLKVNWIEKFSNPDDFSSKEKALNKLNAAKEFCQHNSDVSNWVSSSNREKLFNNYLECMTGCQNTLSFGTGKWIDMIQGKSVLNQIIHSGFFKVKTTSGSELQGKERLKAVIEDLLRTKENILPFDFKKLKQLILDRADIKKHSNIRHT